MDNNIYLSAQEFAELFRVSLSFAYVKIRALNDELKKQGYYTVRGKIPRRYALERFGLVKESGGKN